MFEMCLVCRKYTPLPGLDITELFNNAFKKLYNTRKWSSCSQHTPEQMCNTSPYVLGLWTSKVKRIFCIQPHLLSSLSLSQKHKHYLAFQNMHTHSIQLFTPVHICPCIHCFLLHFKMCACMYTYTQIHTITYFCSPLHVTPDGEMFWWLITARELKQIFLFKWETTFTLLSETCIAINLLFSLGVCGSCVCACSDWGCVETSPVVIVTSTWTSLNASGCTKRWGHKNQQQCHKNMFAI